MAVGQAERQPHKNRLDLWMYIQENLLQFHPQQEDLFLILEEQALERFNLTLSSLTII